MEAGTDRARSGGALDRRLLAESASARRHLIVATLLGVLCAALVVAQASLLAYAIDRAAMHHATLRSLEPALIALGLVLAARAATSAGFELSGRLGASHTLAELRRRMTRRLLLEAPGQWAQNRQGRRTGELAATVVQGVDALQAYFAGYLPNAVLAGVVPLAVAVWVAVQDPIAAAILAFTAPLLIVFMILVGRRAAAKTGERRLALTLLSAHFLDVVRGLPTLRAHRRERAQERTLAEVGERYRAETMATLRVAFLSSLVLELCAMIGVALVAATVGLQLVAGALSLQAGLTVLLLAPEMYAPLREVGAQFHAAADGKSAAERIFEVLDLPAAPHGAPLSHAQESADPGREPIRLRDVSLVYPGRSKPALQNIDLVLPAGRVTALLGQSGAGKSTIALLLMRLIEPSGGSVACGERDLRGLDAEQWRRQIAWVPQTPHIFEGTVAENIALGATPGSPQAPDMDAVAQAARRAGAADFIGALPDGFHTRIGEGARRLSTGQARRIALARAFMRPDARLLILDEPTAQLDRATADEVIEATRRLAQGRTALLITHDPAVAAIADQTIALHDGRLTDAHTRGAILSPRLVAAPAGVSV